MADLLDAVSQDQDTTALRNEIDTILMGPSHTDLGNAQRFCDMYKGRILHNPKLKSWVYWDGRRWVIDERKTHVGLAQNVYKQVTTEIATIETLLSQVPRESTEANLLEGRLKRAQKNCFNLKNAPTIYRMLDMAIPHLIVLMEDLDQDPWKLNVANGTLDLRTKSLHDHQPGDRITRLAPVRFDPKAEAPRWLRFLDEIFPDKSVIPFLQKFCGYSLTGLTREHIFFIFCGDGRNGKSVFLDAMDAMMGDYSMYTDPEVFTGKSGLAKNEMHRLVGARLVRTSETKKGKKLDESIVKQISGEKAIVVKKLFVDTFEAQPKFKVAMSTNHRPHIDGTDEAIWERLFLIPFPRYFQPEEREQDLDLVLLQELSGILNWCLDGLDAYRREGLITDVPESVRTARRRYREEEDTLLEFIENRCAFGPEYATIWADIWGAYLSWCELRAIRHPVGEATLRARLKRVPWGTNGDQRIYCEDGTRPRPWRGITVFWKKEEGKLSS